jgi:hypothetical protein
MRDTNFHQFTRIRGERGEWSLVALLCVLHSTGSENSALAKSFFLCAIYWLKTIRVN